MGSYSKEIERVTMFKLENPTSDIPALIERYKAMSAESKKDGAPYILSLKVGSTNPDDPRHKGFAFAAISRFASIEDMKFYDDADQAHQNLKAAIKPRVTEIMTLYFEDVLSS